MTPERFIAKWQASDLSERAAAQSHFNDLCALLDEPTPADADPKGEWYAFEKGATKSTGGEGWADVWKRGCFAWEYKRRGGNLNTAIDQLKRYADALDNPPLLIACNLERFRIVTQWTNLVSRHHEFDLDSLRDPANRDKLKWAFADPERLRPGLTRRRVTEDAAEKFASLARDLRAAGHDPQTVAHFVNRLVFCMFAQNIELLPNAMFQRMLEEARRDPAEFVPLCRTLFAVMGKGGRFGLERVDWFDGGLFDDDTALPLSRPHIDLVLDAAGMDWSEIDPSILGTLFERGLDPDKRSQLGAHYTDPDKIMKIIVPVIQRPLEAEWAEVQGKIADLFARAEGSRAPGARTRAHNEGTRLYSTFLDRLRAFRVLDPACGSGNFLYLALQTLKDLEHRAGIEAEALGLQRQLPGVGPEQLLGIEINPYAAELARVSVWIGEIQWMRRKGFGLARSPILRPLDTIECRDALLNPDGTDASWPAADVIIGNPPFLGKTKQKSVLGNGYVEKLHNLATDGVPAGADLVCYWFAKAKAQISKNLGCRSGLVATQAIRRGVSNAILRTIVSSFSIFEAWSNEPWIVEGAAVRVSLICFGKWNSPALLDGQHVAMISNELVEANRSQEFSLPHQAARLVENLDIAFHGMEKAGAFDIEGTLAREWLKLPLNPNGRHNSDVLKPIRNAREITGRSADRWIIDFFCAKSEKDASFYEGPFDHVYRNVLPSRIKNNREGKRMRWWLFGENQPRLRRSISRCNRFIISPRVSKYRMFRFIDNCIIPDTRLIAFARADDAFFGILTSRYHELWSLRLCSWHGVGNDPTYTVDHVFETFPFPDGLTPNLPAEAYANDPRAERIAAVARRLNELREAWLNPPDLVVRVPEVVPGFPERILARDEAAAKELKKRTLTNLYNQRPAWLDGVHKELDAAVAAAYAWPEGLSDDEILARLFALNQERAGAGTPTAAA
jgi:hypothetical protein